MRRAAALSSAAWLFFVQAHAQVSIPGAQSFGSQSAVVTPIAVCPFAGDPTIVPVINDGCLTAQSATGFDPQYSYQDSNAFVDGSFFLSGQTPVPGVHPPLYNVTGVDFRIGVKSAQYCTVPALCSLDVNGNPTQYWDPQVYPFSTDPANTGCSKTLSSGYNIHVQYALYCVTGSYNIQANGFDLSPRDRTNFATVQHCVNLIISDNDGSTFVGSMTGGPGGAKAVLSAQNNHLQMSNDPSCHLGYENGSVEGQGFIDGPGILIDVNYQHDWSVHVQNNFIDQNTQNALQPGYDRAWLESDLGGITIFCSTCTTSTIGVQGADMHVTGNVFKNVNQRAISIFGNPCAGFELSNNVAMPYSYWAGGPHGELFFTVGNSNTRHCPGYSSTSWGVMQYVHEINNTVVLASHGGNATASFDNNFVFTGPDFLDIKSGVYGLNTLIGNKPPAYYVSGSTTTINVASANLVANTAGTATVSDILTANIPACAARQPEWFVASVTAGVITALSLADGGSCGSVVLGNVSYPLTCVYCANASPPTGMSTSATSTSDFTASQEIAIETGSDPTQSYTNYEALQIAGNAFGNWGVTGVPVQFYATTGGRGVSCGVPLLPVPTAFITNQGNGVMIVQGNIGLDTSTTNVNAGISSSPTRGTGC